MIKQLTNFIFECLHLKDVKHVWWQKLWIKNHDSVAEHSLNAAQIGYMMAKMEWADANKVCTMLVWHDIAETRVWDMDKVATKYITNKKELEDKVMKDQFENFDFWEEITSYFNEYENKETLEWKIAKDADYLEQAFQAKKYLESGYEWTQNWIDNVWKALQTDSGKLLFNEMLKTKNYDWFVKLKKIQY